MKFADHAAGDLTSRISSWLGFEIIGAAVYHDTLPYNVPYVEPIAANSQICSPSAQHERRKISRMIWMLGFGWIVVAACVRKTFSRAASSLMDVKSKKSRTAVLWQPGYVGNHQNAPRLLIKFDLAKQTWRFISASHLSNRIRVSRTMIHIITSSPFYS